MKKRAKSKAKKVARKKIARKKVQKAKKYPAYMLGIALAAFVLLECALLAPATPADWHAGFSVLDVSDGVTEMASDVRVAFEPAVFTIQSINEFYDNAAVATAQLLDATSKNSDTVVVIAGINNFYKMAAAELEQVLDLSDYAWQPQVAGASISR